MFCVAICDNYHTPGPLVVVLYHLDSEYKENGDLNQDTLI